MSSLLKKIVIVISVVTFILFISLMIAAWTMGMFSPVTVFEANRGPYFIITLTHLGSYQGINEKMEQVSFKLSQEGIPHEIACGIFYDDPARVTVDSLHSEGGFIISDSLTLAEPFITRYIPSRQVAIARIQANPAIAWFKTYPALADWLEKKQFQDDSTIATLELYYPDETVEVELPIITPTGN